MSLIRSDSSSYRKDSIACKKCGRKYPKNTSATRQQYFCSSCGTDLAHPKKQDEKKPLLPQPANANMQKKHKRMGIVISMVLTFAVLLTIYLLFINPSTSIISTKNEPMHFNTTSPTTDPTMQPTMPSVSPTGNPTTNPTMNPTKYPSTYPTIYPTEIPTFNPTVEPSNSPTTEPTLSPTSDPTEEPTYNPSEEPTVYPTTYPTTNPTVYPTTNPTTNPTKQPSNSPSKQPSHKPSKSPTKAPTNVMQSSPFIIGMSIGAGVLGFIIFICIIAFIVGKRYGYSERNKYSKQTYNERMLSHDKTEVEMDNEDNQSEIVMT